MNFKKTHKLLICEHAVGNPKFTATNTDLTMTETVTYLNTMHYEQGLESLPRSKMSNRDRREHLTICKHTLQSISQYQHSTPVCEMWNYEDSELLWPLNSTTWGWCKSVEGFDMWYMYRRTCRVIWQCTLYNVLWLSYITKRKEEVRDNVMRIRT